MLLLHFGGFFGHLGGFFGCILGFFCTIREVFGTIRGVFIVQFSEFYGTVKGGFMVQFRGFQVHIWGFSVRFVWFFVGRFLGCFLCILPAGGGCFGTGNMTQRTGGCGRGGGGVL